MKHIFVDKVIIFKMYKFTKANEAKKEFNIAMPKLNPEDTLRTNINKVIIMCCKLYNDTPVKIMLASIDDAEPENRFAALLYFMIYRGKPGSTLINDWFDKGAWVGKQASSDVIFDDVMQSKCRDLDGKQVSVSNVFSCKSDDILGDLNLNEYVPVFKPDQQ